VEKNEQAEEVEKKEQAEEVEKKEQAEEQEKKEEAGKEEPISVTTITHFANGTAATKIEQSEEAEAVHATELLQRSSSSLSSSSSSSRVMRVSGTASSRARARRSPVFTALQRLEQDQRVAELSQALHREEDARATRQRRGLSPEDPASGNKPQAMYLFEKGKNMQVTGVSIDARARPSPPPSPAP